MLSKAIKSMIEQRYEHAIRYPRDCIGLSNDVYAKTGKKISSSTLRRLFSMTTDTCVPRAYSLDVIANYLEYRTFDDLLDTFCERSGNNGTLSRIDSKSLAIGEIIKVEVSKNVFLSIKFNGCQKFTVVNSSYDSISTGDEIEFNQVNIDLPLFLDCVRKCGINQGPMVLSRISGILSIEIVEKSTKI